MKKLLLFLTVVLMGLSAMAQTTYTKISSESELNAGDKVLFVGFGNDGQAYAMTWQFSNNRRAIAIDEAGGTITTEVATSASSETEPFEFTIGGASGAWTFYDELNSGYLYAPGGGNYLRTQANVNDNATWTLTVNGEGFYPISHGNVEQSNMRYNSTSTLFSCYKETTNPDQQKEIYIYKAGGAPVINPEPSNYPTNFAVTIDRTQATLTWASSTGEQLPRGYVIIGSTSTITVPVDGTPVANDLNGNDGYVAYNVMFGNTTYTFNQLWGNSTWTFAIFPYTNSGENIDYKNGGTYPTASATTGDIYCVLNANFANDLAPFSAFSVEGEQGWLASSHDNIPFAKISGYDSGNSYPNEDWLISPNLFALGRFENMSISFKNAYKYAGPALRVMISNEYDGMSDPTEFEWADITEFFNWSPGEFEWAESGEFMMEEIEATRVYLAFVYTSTASEASTWEVTNVKIYGMGYDAVSENDAVSFNLYPNPANSSINVVAESAAEVQILDMAGRTVMVVNAVEGVNAINVADLSDGVYFVRMNGAVVKFVKR